MLLFELILLFVLISFVLFIWWRRFFDIIKLNPNNSKLDSTHHYYGYIFSYKFSEDELNENVEKWVKRTWYKKWDYSIVVVIEMFIIPGLIIWCLIDGIKSENKDLVEYLLFVFWYALVFLVEKIFDVAERALVDRAYLMLRQDQENRIIAEDGTTDQVKIAMIKHARERLDLD